MGTLVIPKGAYDEDDVRCRLCEWWEQEPKSYQVKGTHAILKGEDVIVHAGTGSGKSRLLASCLMHGEGRVGICAVPLVDLAEDQVRG